MECPRRWIVLCTIFYFSIQVASVFCQIEPLEELSSHQQINELKRDVSKLFIPCSKPAPSIQDDRLRTVNLIPQAPPCYSQDLSIFNQPITSGLNVVLRPQISESTCNGLQRIPLENYQNMVQPAPAVLQLSQPSNDGYNYPPVNLQLSSPSPTLPTINTLPGVIESLSDASLVPLFQEPITLQSGCDDGFPLNLQINVPSQNVPRITVVSAVPAPVTSANSDSVVPFPQFPPPLPIIRKKSRSSLKNLLPILLIALLNDQDCCGNDCCYSCNCNSDSPIPIPFPIPIPINNPIINNDGSSCFSQN